MRYTKITDDAFQTIQLNAGVLATDFTPASGSLTDSNIIGATTGGVTFTATPSFEDFGSDIDNCPKNTKELKRLTEWEIKCSGTFVTISPELAVMLAAAAGKTDGTVSYTLTSDTEIVSGKTYYTRTGSGTEQSPYIYTAVTSPSSSSLSSYYEVSDVGPAKITPRNDLLSGDFDDLWWIGDYSDKNGSTNGGFVAVHMMNALSTGGFQIKTGDKAKGNFSFEFTAHYSINSQDTVPFEVYVRSGRSE